MRTPQPTPIEYRDLLRSKGYRITIGNHGLIFVTPQGGRMRSFISYEEAYKHYLNEPPPVVIVNETFTHFVHCKNKLRNIRTWGNADATARALSDLRAAANECRSYARSHQQ